MLAGRFMTINQRWPYPRAASRRALRSRLHRGDEGDGFVAQALARHKVEGAAVAGPDDPT